MCVYIWREVYAYMYVMCVYGGDVYMYMCVLCVLHVYVCVYGGEV